eukprot:TRINITY_DN518_c0_g1_i6.p1 TRINITY_DN518_c0_g1~~TRINITY_DN518_c0_g1_i6.p1  ORF type:complete len:811 (-),score=214.40 TRINITY_DN518_c0_g1_i6:18-2450(-)
MESEPENSWKLQALLFYPAADKLKKFAEEYPDGAFLCTIFDNAQEQPFSERAPLFKLVFEKLPEIAKAKSIEEVNAVLMPVLQSTLKDKPLLGLSYVFLLSLLILRENQTGPSISADMMSESGFKAWEVPNLKELFISHYSRSGEIFYKKTVCLLFIHTLSLILDNAFIDSLGSSSLWKARHSYTLNNLLSSNVPHLKDASLDYYKQFLERYLKAEHVRCYEGSKGREYKVEGASVSENALLVFGIVNVEFAYCALTFYKYTLAEYCLETAREIGGITHSLTGKMGKKTKYQQQALPQLVLNIDTKTEVLEEIKEGNPQNVPLEEDSILYEKPVLENDELLKQSKLSLYDQIYINGFCRYLMLTRPKDKILTETLTPYISKTLEQSNSWLVYSTSLLNRSRNETDSTKRKERSLLQMQALIDQYSDKSPPALDRLGSSFCAGYPLRWGLRLEMARDYMSIGCFSSAYEMLQDMELYEEAVKCLFLAGRITEAVERAQKVVEGKGREAPGVMCLLADFSAKDNKEREDLYKRAWELSEGKCPRALRSLGRLYYDTRRYDEAVDCLDRALKINTLYASSWFTLGCAHLQLKNWEKALLAFGWVVQVDENSSDGWSNLGVTYTQMNQLKQAVACYEQALKIMRNSWKIWQNYIVLSLEISDISRVLGAIRQLIAMDMQERVPVHVLAKLVDCVLSLPSSNAALRSYEEQVLKLLHEMAHNDSRNTPLWRLYAETYEIMRVRDAKENKKATYEKLADILVKQVRSIMLDPNWEHSEDLTKQVLETLNTLANKYKEGGLETVSYTHLTLPTSDLV